MLKAVDSARKDSAVNLAVVKTGSLAVNSSKAAAKADWARAALAVKAE